MKETTRQFAYIVTGSIGLSCLLGLCLDCITANVAVEYFTVMHPKVVDSQSPWVMALIWGVGASWWFGAIAGAIVGAINARRTAPLPAKRILTWVAVACFCLWLVMVSILIAILIFASTIPIEQRRPTFDYDRRIMAVAMAHQFEYILGAIATIVIAVKTVWATGPKADETVQK